MNPEDSPDMNKVAKALIYLGIIIIGGLGLITTGVYFLLKWIF